MTLQQVSVRFGYSENSFLTNFKRTAAAVEKKYNIIITRFKDEQGNCYYQMTDGRAETVYDQQEINIANVNKEVLKFENFQFIVFLGVALTPWGVFRGTRQDFLKYIGIKKNKKNLNQLEKALQTLVLKDYVAFHEDGKHIIVYIREKIEQEMKIGPKMIQKCRIIAKKNNRTIDKVPQLLKVWLALQICFYCNCQLFTTKTIEDLTALSSYQIRDALQMLQSEEIIKIQRRGNYFRCNGRFIDLNAWYN